MVKDRRSSEARNAYTVRIVSENVQRRCLFNAVLSRDKTAETKQYAIINVENVSIIHILLYKIHTAYFELTTEWKLDVKATKKAPATHLSQVYITAKPCLDRQSSG